MNNKKSESILYKKLDLAFVYIFILLFGLLIVFIMTSYLNNKVKEFTNSSYDSAYINQK